MSKFQIRYFIAAVLIVAELLMFFLLPVNRYWGICGDTEFSHYATMFDYICNNTLQFDMGISMTLNVYPHFIINYLWPIAALLLGCFWNSGLKSLIIPILMIIFASSVICFAMSNSYGSSITSVISGVGGIYHHDILTWQLIYAAFSLIQIIGIVLMQYHRSPSELQIKRGNVSIV